MIIPALKIFEGTISPSVHLGVIYLRAPVTGTIKNVYLNLDGTVETDALFNIRQNGVALWSGSARLTVAGGTGSGSKTGLSVAVTKNDVLILDLEVPPLQSGKVGGNFSLLIEIDDGVPTWTTEQLQDAVAAMMISGTNSSWIYDDAAGTLRVDAPQLTDEEVQDRVGALLSGGANTTVTYNDGANTLIIAETTAGKTQEEIEDIVAALLQQGSNVTLTYNDGANTLTIAASGGGGGYDGGTPTDFLSKFYFQDDFTFSPASTAIGISGYYYSTGGAQLAGEQHHPGIVRLTSSSGVILISSTFNTGGANVFHPGDMFDMNFIIRPNNFDSNTVLRFGFSDNPQSDPASNQICIEKVLADTQFFGVCRASASQTRTAALITPSAGTWYRLRIRRIDALTIGFSVNGGTEATLTANIPTTAMKMFAHISRNSGTKTLDIDFWSITQTGLTRY